MLGLLREKKGLEPEGPEGLRQHIGLDPDVAGSRMAEDRLDMGEAVDMEHFPRIQDLTPCPGPQETVAAWRKQRPPLREGVPDLPQRTSEEGIKGSDEQSRLSGSTTKGQENPHDHVPWDGPGDTVYRREKECVGEKGARIRDAMGVVLCRPAWEHCSYTKTYTSRVPGDTEGPHLWALQQLQAKVKAALQLSHVTRQLRGTRAICFGKSCCRAFVAGFHRRITV